ncbi:MAG: FKBP-type peptidyl-prolyl cis-trans isomerase, partial [Ktedonobacteraceae bacterium]
MAEEQHQHQHEHVQHEHHEQHQQKKPKVKKLYIIAPVVVIAIIIGIYLATNISNASTVGVGDTVSVYYTGTLTNGTVFDSNVGKQPLTFVVGAGQLILGFDNGVI